MTDVIQVCTTTASRDDAEKIARALLDVKLAACIQISSPLISYYWWKGKVETAEEWLCTIKTRGDAYEQVERVIQQTHPYDEPEIIAVPVVAGSEGYINWVKDEVRLS